MIYSSGEYMIPEGDPNNGMQVPPPFWKKRGARYKESSQLSKHDSELIPVDRKVSSRDYEGVCHLCP
jgi:hypothetical protein